MLSRLSLLETKLIFTILGQSHMLRCLFYSVIVSTKCQLGFDSHSRASQPRKMTTTVTLAATPFSGLIINSMNRMGVREDMVKGAQMEDIQVTPKFGMDQS